ncbi:MAG TPA: rhodanese-like domain-containing protein [Gammaproteobacteria bacterium]|jgi:rhodanese-related sulfurtransferase
MKHFTDLIAEALPEVEEIFPWDLEEKLREKPELILLDVREPSEFDALHIANSLNVPRGILESACDWDYDETEPALAAGRNEEIVVICRSGNRSVLAAQTMQRMGFRQVVSLKTGIRGWNDFEQPLYNRDGEPVDIDDADVLLASKLRPEQRRPAA